MKKYTHQIVEQDAVYDCVSGSTLPFPAIGMLMSLLNYYCEGGTRDDAARLKASGECPNARLFRTRIIVEVEEYDEA